MLVYANCFDLVGDGAREAALKAIGGWIKQQLGRGLMPEKLVQDGKYEGEKELKSAKAKRPSVNSWLEIRAAGDEEPRLYAWILKTGDEAVRGRQWVTELGWKQEGGRVRLSVLLRTEELNVLAGQSPVQASTPNVVSYLVKNILAAKDANFAPGTEGLAVKVLEPDHNAFEAFYAEVKRRTRRRPLVLVAATDVDYLVDCEDLQKKLLGLAQVVRVHEDCNSYEMAEVLGDRFSAWSGAINLIGTPDEAGVCHNRLFLSRDIEQWGASLTARTQQMLMWVTSWTNLSQYREHVRPEGVSQLQVRRRLNRLRTLQTASLQQETQATVKDLEQLIEIAEEEQRRFKSEIDGLRSDLNRLEQENSDLKSQAHADAEEISLLRSLAKVRSHDSVPRESLAKIVEFMGSADFPRPEQCLELIKLAYGDHCVILDSAWQSASKMNGFRHGRQLLDLLRRLVVDYRQALQEGGDAEAKRVFGKNEFAAKESETVMKNAEMKRQREFEYEGKAVPMFKHLKIGVDDDETKTIRVHFHWDSKAEKIVIGHCGRHLKVSSR